MIEPAALAWRDGQPYSTAFEDIYHDRDGVAETERVFLAPAQFDSLLEAGRPLVVGELGFGTGLNFAVIARHCLARGVPIHFVSFEAAPIAPADFQAICRLRQGAEPVYSELAGLYPPLLSGWHRRQLAGGRIHLSLFWGPAEAGITALAAAPEPVDVWLLDGFSPDRNPGMWTEDLFSAIGRTATQGTRVTTFTAAGRVRRGLAAAGFDMRRVDQRPRKRESLAGVFTDPGRPRTRQPARITVAGAGIAGATVARELAQSGISVRVLETAPEPATGASSIPATVMHPRLHHDGSPGAQLKAISYAHAVAATRSLADQPGTGVRRTGALQVPSPNFPTERLAAVAEVYARTGLGVRLVDGQTAGELVRAPALKLPDAALWFPDACTVDTPALTRYLLDHPAIELVTGTTLSDWPEEPTVLACGMAARSLPGAAFLELGVVAGQLDRVARGEGLLKGLAAPITGHGYLAPLDDAAIAVGATYEYEPWTPEKATGANLRHLVRLEGEPRQIHGRSLSQHRATRCVASDRNPVVGALVDLEGEENGDRLVSVGHGSMGTVSTHLAASLIGAAITGSVRPLTGPLRAMIEPGRFRIRQARRGYRFGATP